MWINCETHEKYHIVLGQTHKEWERKKRDKRRMTSDKRGMTTCGNTLKNHIEKIQRKSHQENTAEKCTTFVQLRCNDRNSWQWKRHRMVRRSSIYIRLRTSRKRKAERRTLNI